MPKIFKLSLLCCFTALLTVSPLWAWEDVDHSMIAQQSLSETAVELKLDKLIRVSSLDDFLQKLSKITGEIKTKNDLCRFLKISPNTGFDTQSLETTPLAVIEEYASEPDKGRDKDLFTIGPDEKKIPISWEQRWMGGYSSQAFRHIEKPPFNLSRPGSTFGIPPITLGQATRRAQIYFDLALIAHSLGEDYWGWRFLANALHYPQDITQPYHTIQITPTLLTKGLKSYLAKRNNSKGLSDTLSDIVSNTHRFFEAYVHTRNDPRLKNAPMGTDKDTIAGGVMSYVKKIRDDSNNRAAEAVRLTLDITGENLFSSHKFKYPPDNPDDFLTGDIEKQNELNEKIIALAEERFKKAGRVCRTIVSHYLEKTKGPIDVNALLEEIKKLR